MSIDLIDDGQGYVRTMKAGFSQFDISPLEGFDTI